MTTVNIDLSVQQPLVELDVAAGQAVLVPKISAQDLSKMEELVAAAAASETAAGEHAQTAQGSAATASEQAQSARESATTAGQALTSMQGMVDAADNSAKAAKLAESAANESASNTEILMLAAQAAADSVQESALKAQTEAEAAEESAEEARTEAQAAKAAAETSQSAIIEAQAQASTAQAAAENAEQWASDAKNASESALAAAGSAQASVTTTQVAQSESQQAAAAAAGSAAAAAGSAVNAKASETAALAASQAAQVSAVTVNEAVAVAGGHAQAASASASDSTASALAAQNSATTASESATTAGEHAQAARGSATTASESATTAGGHATTAQASATNSQASAQAAAKSLSDMALLVGGNDDLYAKMRLYTQSRLGLIANGSGGMGDNYNFSTMSYTQKDVYFGRGAFISNTLGGIHTTDEKIPLEPDSNYEFSVYARCLEKGDATSTAQGINLARCFDVDGLDILPQHVGMITVKLGAPLQNGDTTVTIHPDDRERMRVWVAANSNGGNVHVANPDYVNSKGYRYERGTYVREIYNTGAATPGASLLYDAGSGVLRMFTINAAPAGGVASNGSITFTKTGSVYVYAIGNMNGTAIPTDKWQRFSGRFSTNTLRPGTAEIVIGCQLNRSSRYGTKTALSAMSLHKVF